MSFNKIKKPIKIILFHKIIKIIKDCVNIFLYLT